MKKEITDSDQSSTILASKLFDKILQDIQASNLNFHVLISPFSAQISLKKSFVKDKNGSVRIPHSLSSRQPEVMALETKVKQLEKDLEAVRVLYVSAVDDCVEANEKN